MIGRMTTASEEDWPRLAAHIERRLNELRLQWKDIPDRGGPSTAKVRELRNGNSQTLNRSKRRDLERALEWVAGSVDEVLAGGEPTNLENLHASLQDVATDDLLSEIRSRIPDDPQRRRPTNVLPWARDISGGSSGEDPGVDGGEDRQQGEQFGR